MFLLLLFIYFHVNISDTVLCKTNLENGRSPNKENGVTNLRF